MKPFTSKHCTPINYGSPLNNNKKETYKPLQGGITKSVISTKIGPKENKGYTIENTTPKGLYTSDAVSYTHLTLPTICSV